MAYSIGEDIFREITIVDEDGAAVDISSASFLIYFFLTRSITGALWTDTDGLQKTIGSGITKTTPVSGIAEIHIEDTDTEDYTPGTYYAWVKAINATGYEWDVIKGEKMQFAHSPLKNI
jgi:hypothetical protein